MRFIALFHMVRHILIEQKSYMDLRKNITFNSPEQAKITADSERRFYEERANAHKIPVVEI
jgi:hypothetical protein